MEYRIQGKILPRILDMEEYLQKLTELESKVITTATLDQDSLNTKLQNNLTVKIAAKPKPLANLQELFYSQKLLHEDLITRPDTGMVFLRPEITKK